MRLKVEVKSLLSMMCVVGQVCLLSINTLGASHTIGRRASNKSNGTFKSPKSSKNGWSKPKEERRRGSSIKSLFCYAKIHNTELHILCYNLTIIKELGCSLNPGINFLNVIILKRRYFAKIDL